MRAILKENTSLHSFLHSTVQIYEFHIFIISSSPLPCILRTNLMTSSQLAWGSWYQLLFGSLLFLGMFNNYYLLLIFTGSIHGDAIS